VRTRIRVESPDTTFAPLGTSSLEGRSSQSVTVSPDHRVSTVIVPER
jgi:hypothetical protein